MAKWTLLFFGLFTAAYVQAQTLTTTGSAHSSRKNTIYIEAGGICAYYSANYQRNFHVGKNVDLAAGIALAPVYIFNRSSESKFTPRVGIQLQGVYKINRHELCFGLASAWYTWYYPSGSIEGGKYQKVRNVLSLPIGYGVTTKRNIYLGVYVTPFLTDNKVFSFVPWAGFRAGYRF